MVGPQRRFLLPPEERAAGGAAGPEGEDVVHVRAELARAPHPGRLRHARHR